MSRSLRSRAPVLLGLVAVPVAAACTGAPLPPAASPRKPGETMAAAERPPSPARYFLTSAQGAIFDEATRGAAVPRRELAIVQGRRVALEGGAVTSVARAPAGLVGFRSLPARLGGGFLVWSDVRTYHTNDFLGALTPVAEIGPTAGTRPWFGAVLLRADRGVFSLDLKTRSLTRYRPHPGVIDALAIDEKRGVTLDVVGRVRATTDGGATWTDVTASRGFFANAARLGKKGEIELVSFTGSADFRLVPGGTAVEPVPPSPPAFARRYYGYNSYPYQYANPPYQPAEPEGVEPFSQQLAPDTLSWAASAGVLLGGDRAVVGREGGGVVVLSTKSGAELNSAGLLGVDPQYANCQPVSAGSALLLACAHAQGAQVLSFDGPVAVPKLEATFPDAGGTFVTDDRGHLAFTGRCGRTPPSADDFGARVVQRPPYMEEDPYGGGYGPYGGYNPDYVEPPPDEPTEKEKPPADDKRLCVRLTGGDWIEHRLTGESARDLYRWVLGDDGAVTALLLEGANPEEEEEKKDEDEGDLRRRMLDGDGALPKPRPDLLATPTAQPKAAPPPTAPKAGATAQPKAAAPSAPKAGTTAQPKAGAPPPKKTAPKTEKPAAPKAKPEAPKAGVRTVRLDPDDRGLKHGKWIRVAPPLQQAPWRSADPSFWLEEDGSVRGWVRLPEEDASGGRDQDRGEHDGGGEGDAPPIAEETSGRFAGVRVSPQGKATVLPLPPRVRSVLFGGRFGFARAEDDSGERIQYFETTDGGATWTEVEGPPVGDVEDAYDDSRWPACSALGCTLATGLVRVGWGSPKPAVPKKEKETSDSGADLFPVPRMPKLSCKFDGEPEAFPPPAPRAKPAPAAAAPSPPSPGGAPPLDENALSQLPPDLQEILRQMQAGGGSIPPGLIPPGLIPPASSGTPSAPPKPSSGPKAGKPPAAAKPPPTPPAEIVSLRTKPQSPLGQLKDKSWIADFLVPFDPAAPLKHVSTGANGLEKLVGSVVPVLGDRGVDLLLAWERRRALLGSASAALAPFEYNGRLSSAVTVTVPGAAGAKGAAAKGGSAIVAIDEDKRVLVLIQPDASRPFLRTAKIPDPTRGRLVIARRLDAPGASVVWYSPQSGEVLAGAVDFGRAEIGPLAPLASIGTLTDGGLPACSASEKPAGPAYEFLAELALPVNVTANSGKTLFSESAVASTLLVRATERRLCVSGIEVRGGPRPLDLTVSLGNKGAAVSRSRASAEDPTKLSIDKLSCLLKEPDPR